MIKLTVSLGLMIVFSYDVIPMADFSFWKSNYDGKLH